MDSFGNIPSALLKGRERNKKRILFTNLLSSVVRTSFLYYYLSGLENLSWEFSSFPQPQSKSFLAMSRTRTAEKCTEMKNPRKKCANPFFLIVKCAYLRRFFFLFFSVAVVMVTLGFLNFGAFSTCHYWDQFWLVPIVCILQLTGSVGRDGRKKGGGGEKKKTLRLPQFPAFVPTRFIAWDWISMKPMT